MGEKVTLMREELYTHVWAEPMIQVAARYKITGRGLAKACERLGVPVPPRGYWQRKRVGKPDPQPVLSPIAHRLAESTPSK